MRTYIVILGIGAVTTALVFFVNYLLDAPDETVRLFQTIDGVTQPVAVPISEIPQLSQALDDAGVERNVPRWRTMWRALVEMRGYIFLGVVPICVVVLVHWRLSAKKRKGPP